METTTSPNAYTFRMFLYTHVHIHLFIWFYFDLHALHWRDSFYQWFFACAMYNTTVRNNFCSFILIIALFCCVCVVCSFTQLYTLTQHRHFRFVVLRFVVSALVKCSWPIDKKFEKLGDKNTPSQQKLSTASACLLCFDCSAVRRAKHFERAIQLESTPERVCACHTQAHTRMYSSLSLSLRLLLLSLPLFHFGSWCRRWGRAVVDTRSRNRSRSTDNGGRAAAWVQSVAFVVVLVFSRVWHLLLVCFALAVYTFFPPFD